LSLALDPTHVLNYGVAKDHIKAACLEIGFAAVPDYISCPIHFIAMLIHVQNRKLRAYWNQGPVERATAHIQDNSVHANGKELTENCHAAAPKVPKQGPIKPMDV
jgi:hypothetical protein